MRLRNASRAVVVRHVVVPCCLEYFFAGLRIAGPASVIGAIVAEFNGAEHGTGKDIFIAARRLEPELMMTSILLSSLLAGIMYGLVRVLELIPGAWYRHE
jgi:ABC-type nitrate/sulfonate/bicarbonate transport system permease component